MTSHTLQNLDFKWQLNNIVKQSILRFHTHETPTELFDDFLNWLFIKM